ncbi:MAG: sigma-70 family RNA polymerase sigma factor [Candidatus Eisenbacteria bacterium]|nr:sigma-70 family RNA polymerase sigma factor [Candidatus Eisenbacteria bacterium]
MVTRTQRGREARVEPPYLRDAELLKACRLGDDAAWRELMRRYRDLIYSIPRRYGLDADDTADVFQIVIAALWKGLAELRSEKALTRWIQVTTRRQSQRQAEKIRRHASVDVLARQPDPDLLVSERLHAAESAHRVRRELDRLGSRCREILTLLYMEEPPMGYDEVARRMGLPRGSIGPTRGRCLDKLRALMGKDL